MNDTFSIYKRKKNYKKKKHNETNNNEDVINLGYPNDETQIVYCTEF